MKASSRRCNTKNDSNPTQTARCIQTHTKLATTHCSSCYSSPSLQLWRYCCSSIQARRLISLARCCCCNSVVDEVVPIHCITQDCVHQVQPVPSAVEQRRLGWFRPGRSCHSLCFSTQYRRLGPSLGNRHETNGTGSLWRRLLPVGV